MHGLRLTGCSLAFWDRRNAVGGFLVVHVSRKRALPNRRYLWSCPIEVENLGNPYKPPRVLFSTHSRLRRQRGVVLCAGYQGRGEGPTTQAKLTYPGPPRHVHVIAVQGKDVVHNFVVAGSPCNAEVAASV